jgi:hypothetical protein
VFDQSFRLDHDGLVHLVTDNGPDQLSFHSAFFHGSNNNLSLKLWVILSGLGFVYRQFFFPNDGLHPGHITLYLFEPLRIFKLSGCMLKAEVEQLLLHFDQLLLALFRAKGSYVTDLHDVMLLSTNFVLTESLWAASRKASSATSLVTPSIS